MGYALKAGRAGFDIKPDWLRVDLPANDRGFRYTEFRDRSGECKAMYLTALLGAK